MPTTSKGCYYDLYTGVRSPITDTVDESVQFGNSVDADFVVVDICVRHCGTYDDYVDVRRVPTEVMNTSVVGCVSLPNSTGMEGIITSYCESIRNQIEWACHAGMYAVLIAVDRLPSYKIASLINDVNSNYPAISSVTRWWLQCKSNDWTTWDTIRTMAASPSKLSVVLDLQGSDSFDSQQWFGEPISAFTFTVGEVIPSTVMELVRRNAQPICHTGNAIDAVKKIFLNSPALSPEDQYVAPYYDCLQVPLQPLADNMDNGTYETFEYDKIKYTLYENAIYNALLDRNSRDFIHIAVVGAGRGGLVDSGIRAISRVSGDQCLPKRFLITAVEKNKHAARTLLFRKHKDGSWSFENNAVQLNIVNSDMREWKPDIPVDVLVSELLGSLGDNEASPECIDGAIRHVNPHQGVCIPSRYYSSLEPVAAHKAWLQVRESKKFQTPLVVYLHNVGRASIPRTLFTFEHTPGLEPVSNEKSQILTWHSDRCMTIHGFAGYFHCDLYKNISMSIHPPTKTETMVSWFPAFLPLTVPVRVARGQEIQLLVERKIHERKMWIEWTLLSPVLQSTQNACGHAHYVGL